MELININNDVYFKADELLIHAPIYCKNIRNSRELIRTKNITSYIYARLNKDEWKQTDGKSIKLDKILIKENFLKNIPELNNNNNIEYEPDIIELEDNEKFKDSNGNICNIETRGERSHDKIFFKVKDVAIAFNIDNLYRVIIDKNKSYTENIDYKYFISRTTTNSENDTIKKTIARDELYLTYQGLLRVLFVSRNNKTSHFIKWACEVLFIAQLGTPEQKQELSATLLGIHPKIIRDVFNSESNKTPCIYLILIGNASLINEANTNNDELLCKYGCTDDLGRRINEHEKAYKKLFNTNISLLCYSIIDNKYIFNAETNIRQYFKGNKAEYKNMNELIIINKRELESIKIHFRMIQKSYIGKYEEFNNKLQAMEKEITELNNKLILKDMELKLISENKDNKLVNKEMELKLTIESKDKDIIIEKQKNEILEMKLRLLSMSKKK